MELEFGDLSWSGAALLLLAGLMAGIANAVAGGGTFITFPALLATGLPPIVANASNALAVWPGHALAAWSYRRELRPQLPGLKLSLVIALAGGTAGAALLLWAGNERFTRLIPLLLLFATALFALGPRLAPDQRALRSSPSGSARALSWITEFLIAVYGGFFGAGLGILLMAGLLLLGVRDPQENNALKNLLGTAISSSGAVFLALSGLIAWPHTAVAFTGAFIGGWLGGGLARRLPAAQLRAAIIVLGLFLTTYYAVRYYGPGALT